MSIRGQDYLTMFADASYCKDLKLAGWAYWMKFRSPKSVLNFGHEFGVLTSVDAEVMAIEKGIEYILDKFDLSGVMVIIQSDCCPALDRFKSRDLFGSKSPKSVEYRHVRGHQGVKSPRYAVNSTVDAYARREMRRVRDLITYGATE